MDTVEPAEQTGVISDEHAVLILHAEVVCGEACNLLQGRASIYADTAAKGMRDSLYASAKVHPRNCSSFSESYAAAPSLQQHHLLCRAVACTSQQQQHGVLPHQPAVGPLVWLTECFVHVVRSERQKPLAIGSSQSRTTWGCRPSGRQPSWPRKADGYWWTAVESSAAARHSNG